VRAYAGSLSVVLRHRFITLMVLLATIAMTVNLYVKMPKGYFPQDDTGLIFGSTQAAADISYEAMAKLQDEALNIVLADPAVAGVGSSVGASGFNASVNQGRMFISLKPLAERDGLTTARVIDRMRRELAGIEGLNVYMFASQDIRVGARQGRASYQITLWSPDIDELYEWVPKVLDRLRQVPEIVDVNNDREQGGLQLSVNIDRMAAARLGVDIQDIDNALNNAFAQRQISTIYTARNQYKVILEIDPRFQRDPSDLSRVFVPGRGGAQVPLTSVITTTRTLTPLVVNHQGQFPAVTFSYNLPPDMNLDEATQAIRAAIDGLHLPSSIRVEAAGDA
jgi:multidrug efflux pump